MSRLAAELDDLGGADITGTLEELPVRSFVVDGEGVVRSQGAQPALEGTRLTQRQLEVLQLLAEGKSTQQIADELVLSKTTVRNHIAHVLANLGAHTRVQAVIAASKAGVVRLPPPE